MFQADASVHQASALLEAQVFCLQVCRPCEAADAPGAVKVVWQLVDEYTLLEAERAMLKLLRGLDKHLQHVQQAAAASVRPQSADPESSATVSAPPGPTTAENPDQSNAIHALQTAQPAPDDGSAMISAVPEMWENPLATMDDSVHDRQQLAHQSSQYSCTDGAPDQSQQGVESSSVNSQAEPGVASHQMPNQSVLARSPRPSSDQQARRFTGDARRITEDARRSTGDARCVTGDPRHIPGDARRMTRDTETKPVTNDMQMPIAGSSSHVTIKASVSGRKEKLEYRLSHDDVYSPTPEEVQALLQQGLLDTQQQQQLLPYYASYASSDVASNMQSSLNGLSEGGRSAAANIVADASVMSGLSGSQAGASVQQEKPDMLSLIARVKDIQVRLEALVEWPC